MFYMHVMIVWIKLNSNQFFEFLINTMLHLHVADLNMTTGFFLPVNSDKIFIGLKQKIEICTSAGFISKVTFPSKFGIFLDHKINIWWKKKLKNVNQNDWTSDWIPIFWHTVLMLLPTPKLSSSASYVP